MSNQLNDKQQAAMRLFGALSGVDEQYLAACETDKGTVKSGGVVVFVKKFGKPLAAVLCLAVLGAGYATMQTEVKTSSDSAAMAPAANEMAADVVLDMESAVEEAPQEMYEEVGSAELREPAGSQITNDGASMSVGQSKPTFSESADAWEEKQKTQNEDVQTGKTDIWAEENSMTLAQAQALEVVGEFVPTQWPSAGALVTVGSSQVDGLSSVTLHWSYPDNPDGFIIEVNQFGKELPQWLEGEIADGYIVSAEEFTQEYVESQIKTPSGNDGGTDIPEGRFGVLHQSSTDYVLVRFNGSGTVDDIWMLMN